MSGNREGFETAQAFDALWRRARSDLVLRTDRGDDDVFLWEHSARVAKTSLRIVTLPEVRAVSPDETVLAAAALYHDAGWISRVHDREIAREDVLITSVPPTHYEQSALVLQKSLSKLLAREVLRRAGACVCALADRDTDSVEAQIVAEADCLDEFGMPSLWSTIRRGVAEGKAVQAAVETWRRRREYHFWEARLNDSFRFPSVRAIAEQRLAHFERVMEVLETQALGDDVSSDQRVARSGSSVT